MYAIVAARYVGQREALGAYMLKFPNDWRYEAPGERLPFAVTAKFSEFVTRIAMQGDRWAVVEHYKRFFSGAAGMSYHASSSLSWAESDLSTAMDAAAANTPLFIEAFYDACRALQEQHPDFGMPDVARINRVLAEYDTGYEIREPDLLFVSQSPPVPVPDRAASLDEQARSIIQTSLKESERLLTEGRNRQAVAEILWLLETVATAFRGVDTGAGTVQEKYFNKIAQELRRHHKGGMLEQVLNWVTALHGFLSSPTGGGVRHGTDIRSAVEVPSGDARLYCNLIRSYIGYLMNERMSRASNPFL
jgi:hypothetical protein